MKRKQWRVGFGGALLLALMITVLACQPGPEATPTFAVQTRLDAQGVPMVYVPAGVFIMGSTLEDAVGACQRARSSSDCAPWRFVDETPPQRVTLAAFWLDQDEVSNGQYAACVAAGTCPPPQERDSFHREAYYGEPAFAAYPVINVDHAQAAALCAWRGARLPSEAEWEYAARGPQEALFPWGEETPGERLANYGMKTGDTAAPDAYPDGVSWVGARHLTGNVWEWTASPYVPYPGYTAPDFDVPPDGQFNAAWYVQRGGSWGTDQGELRASERLGRPPDIARSSMGFRCAADGA